VADSLGNALAVRVDVSDSESVEDAAERIESELGPLGVWVNNAGIIGVDHVRRVRSRLDRQDEERVAGDRVTTPLDAVVRLSDEEWRSLMAVHLDGTFFGTRTAARRMAPRGSGAIVNMSSICGIEGCVGHPHYSAACGS